MSALGFDHGSSGAVMKMDKALEQASRLLRQILDCPDDGLCDKCRENAKLFRAHIREVRGFKPEPADR